jgi:GNAT superfamily N-acetyltransferase
MTINIVKFAPAHHAEILSLSLRSWAPVFTKLQPVVADYVYEAFYPKGWQTRQTSEIEAFLKAEGENVWVALEGEIVLGWVGIRLHAEDHMGEIYILAVDPDHQRRGVGAALIDHAIAKMRQANMKIAMVETGDDSGHAPSRASYERAGFERWPVARYFRKL